jgi:ocular albinism type 1 protein
MAAPVGESFFCIPEDMFDKRQCLIYSGISVATGLLGFFGALYQLSIWKPHQNTHVQYHILSPSPDTLQRSSNIIFSLALSDLFACSCVVLKGIALPLIERPSTSGENNHYKVRSMTYVYWGLPLEYFERFFYLCTYMWTLSFAIDILLKLKGKIPDQRMYHIIWPLAAVMIGGNITVLLVDSVDYCTVCLLLQLAYIPSYWLPVFTVMFVNPILYVCIARYIHQQLQSTGRYTDDERHLLNIVRVKFLLMMAVFYFCWWTAIMALTINIQSSCSHSTHGLLLIFSAVFNPLQGLLNCLVYGKHQWFTRFGARTQFVRYTSPSPDSPDNLFQEQQSSNMLSFTASTNSIQNDSIAYKTEEPQAKDFSLTQSY